MTVTEHNMQNFTNSRGPARPVNTPAQPPTNNESNSMAHCCFHMRKKSRFGLSLFFIFCGLTGFLFLSTGVGLADQPRMVLADAVVCERISNCRPVNPAAVFSVSLGEVFCFSEFDPVYEKTAIFHNWYKKDKLIFSMRLVLSVPKWSSFSRVQMRDADSGPWRVEIRDEDNHILKTLRFNMSD